MKALLNQNLVVDVADVEFEVHSSLTWIDCPDGTEIGSTYDGSTFTPPHPENPTYTAEEKLQHLIDMRDSILSTCEWMTADGRVMTQAETDYKTAVENITNTYQSLENVVWPSRSGIDWPND